MIEFYFAPSFHLVAVQTALGQLAIMEIGMALNAAIALHSRHQVNGREEILTIGEFLAAHVGLGENDCFRRQLMAVGAL